MYYEVYIDVVFLTNLVMDFILLRLVNRALQCHSSLSRSLLGAVIGALMACLILMIPTDSFFPIAFLLHLLGAAAMAKVGCNAKSGNMLLKTIVALYLAAFLCGGFWDVMSTNGGITLKTFLIFSSGSYLLFTCCSVFYDYLKVKKKNIYPVTLGYGGRVESFHGLYDTGNLLTDTISRKPVSVIAWEALEKLLTEELLLDMKNFSEKAQNPAKAGFLALRPHYLTYSGVGAAQGILLAFTLDDLCIHTPSGIVHIFEPVLATDVQMSMGKDYQLILNSQIMNP